MKIGTLSAFLEEVILETLKQLYDHLLWLFILYVGFLHIMYLCTFTHNQEIMFINICIEV